jgi:hypothetical protein
MTTATTTFSDPDTRLLRLLSEVPAYRRWEQPELDEELGHWLMDVDHQTLMTLTAAALQRLLPE